MIADLRIRPATPSDHPAFARIVAEAYGVYIERLGRQPMPMVRDYRPVIEAGQVWVAERGGAVVGLIVLIPEADHLLIENIAVDPAWHKQGVGGALMRFAEAEAGRQSYAALRLYTNEKMVENIAIYSGMGWRETHRDGQFPLRRVFFTKRLPA